MSDTDPNNGNGKDNDDVVTLRAVTQADSRTGAPGRPVEIRMHRSTATKVVEHSRPAWCVSKPFNGYDANGNPFHLNVGYVTALWIEEGTE